MRRRLADERGYSLIEMLVVMVMLGAVLGGLISIFSTGINADADQNRRFQAQQAARLALDKFRREAHNACQISAPATYNTPLSSVTFYFPYTSAGTTTCSSTNQVTWCTVANGVWYDLDRVLGASCTGTLQVYASYLTKQKPFTYLPPNSHLMSASSLGGGTTSTYISTIDGSSALPRVYLDIPINLKPAKTTDAYELMDVAALRNGVRLCPGAAAYC